MIYSYLKHNLFWRYFFLGQTCLKPINGRIDNKMAVFFQKCVLKQNLKDKQKNLQLEPLEKKYSDLIEEMVINVKS